MLSSKARCNVCSAFVPWLPTQARLKTSSAQPQRLRFIRQSHILLSLQNRMLTSSLPKWVPCVATVTMPRVACGRRHALQACAFGTRRIRTAKRQWRKDGHKKYGALLPSTMTMKTRMDSVESKRWYTHVIGEHLVTIVATFAPNIRLYTPRFPC